MPAFEPAFQAFSEEPQQEIWTPTFEQAQESIESPVEEQLTDEQLQPLTELTMPPVEELMPTEESQAELERTLTPEPVEEQPVVEEPVVEEPVVEEPVVEEPVVEEPVVEEPVVEEPVVEEPVVEEPVVEEPVVEEPVVTSEMKKIATMTQQAEDLKAALRRARESQQLANAMQQTAQRKPVEKPVDERRRRVLLGKHATKTITADSGTLVVELGAEVTEEVLQRARLSNKFIELSMNVQ